MIKFGSIKIINMGTCRFCGKTAGVFSRAHKECEEKHREGAERMRGLMRRYFDGVKTAEEMRAIIERNRIPYYLDDEDIARSGIDVLTEYVATLRRPYPQLALDKIRGFIDNLGVDRPRLNDNGQLDAIGKKLMEGYLVDYFAQGVPLARVRMNAASVSRMLPISPNAEREAYYSVLNKAASKFMVDGVLTSDEERLITTYVNNVGINLNELPQQYRTGDLQKIGQAIVLRNLEQGILPSNPISVPVILSKGEVVLWVYDDVTMHQEKIQRETRGRTGGFSFRICKGVTYRTGQFRGKPVEYSYLDRIGVGSLIISTKHIFFHCQTSSMKIPYSKLVGITPYDDGLEVHKEEATPKRTIFTGFDPWFVLNVINYVNN